MWPIFLAFEPKSRVTTCALRTVFRPSAAARRHSAALRQYYCSAGSRSYPNSAYTFVQSSCAQLTKNCSPSARISASSARL